MEFTEYDTRLAAYALITNDRRELLLSWYNGAEPGWTLPGGGVEFEEEPAAAMVREVHEETGFTVVAGRLLAVDTITFPVGRRSPRPYKGVRLIFAATIMGGTLGTLEVGGTTDRAEWVSLDRLLDAGVPRAGIVDLARTLAG